MNTILAKNWWIFLVRGFAALLFGLAVFVFPGAALSFIVTLIAVYFLIDGVFAVIYALQHRARPRWWVALLEGLVGILAAIGAFLYPGITSLVLLYIVAFWAAMTGLMEIIYAIEMRKHIQNEWWLILSGVVSILFGALLILFPGAGILSLLTLVGAFAFAFGIIMIVFAFRLRGLGSSTTART
jgi:uncharacterized membrane protein HdeD (DUF308 family)